MIVPATKPNFGKLLPRTTPESVDASETPTKEKWMNGIKWFKFPDALDAIEYDDIEKLMLIAKTKIRSGDF